MWRVRWITEKTEDHGDTALEGQRHDNWRDRRERTSTPGLTVAIAADLSEMYFSGLMELTVVGTVQLVIFYEAEGEHGKAVLAAAPLIPGVLRKGKELLPKKGTNLADDTVKTAVPAKGVLSGSSRLWGKNRFVKELYKQGFVLKGPTKSGGGLIYTNPITRAEVRIMPRPNRMPFKNEPLAKFMGDFYYRYKPGPGKEWGPHIPLPGGG